MAKQHPAQQTEAPKPGPALVPTPTTPEDMAKEIERLRSENANLKADTGARGTQPVTLKVSEKGALSVYGMGRFPVSLYREQWSKLLEHADQIRQFIVDHDKELKRKDDGAK